MSYEKVKSIKIDEANGKVFITCASNNCRPLYYSKEEYPAFSNVLKEKGRDAVELMLFKNYEEGNLQDGNNKYTKALKVLSFVFGEEYAKFHWRNNNAKYGSEEYREFHERRESKEFDELLRKALNYKLPKKRFVITKYYDGEKIYAKVCPSCIKWSRFNDKATKFEFEENAKNSIYNAYKDKWAVEVLA